MDRTTTKPTYFPRGYGPRQLGGRERSNHPQYRVKSPNASKLTSSSIPPSLCCSHENTIVAPVHTSFHDEKHEKIFQPLADKYVVHNKRANYDVYIGNPSKWGTPFKIGPDGNRKECVQKYREWLTTSIEGQQVLEEAKRELPGKVLACWCAPLPCHGHVLAELVNTSPQVSLGTVASSVPCAEREQRNENLNPTGMNSTTREGDDDAMMFGEDESTPKLRSKRYSTWRLNYYAMSCKVGYRQPFFVPVVLQHAPLPAISVTLTNGGQ